jgi:hypothetical protein
MQVDQVSLVKLLSDGLGEIMETHLIGRIGTLVIVTGLLNKVQLSI